MRSHLSEYEAVEQVAQKFAEAVSKGDPNIAKPYFYDQAVMFGLLSGKLEQGTIQNLWDNLDNAGADPKYKHRVDILALEETAAVVQVIEDDWVGHDFTDFLIMLKLQGKWQVVAKVYNENSKRPADIAK